MINTHIIRTAKHYFPYLCFSICVLLVSSCGIIAEQINPNPNRYVHAIFYDDLSCQISFEGLSYGERKDQSWTGNTLLAINYKGVQPKPINYRGNYTCLHSLAESTDPKYAENWPLLSVEVKPVNASKDLSRTAEGHVEFRPESDKRFESNADLVNTVAWKNGDNLYVHVYMSSGTKLNEKAIGATYGERYLFGSTYVSTDNPSNKGVFYFQSERQKTGIFMEVRSEVIARPAAN